MKRWWAIGVTMVALASSAPAAPTTLPVYIEDSHAGSFYWLAEHLPLDEPVTLIHFDAHSDASAIFDSDQLRTRLRRVSSSEERRELLAKWRRAGAVQCFNWIEPLMPAPIARVIWVPGDRAPAEAAQREREAGDLLDGHAEAAPRSEGRFRERFRVAGLEELAREYDVAGPVIVTIDLDYFAEVPGADRAAAFERVWTFVCARRNLHAVTFAISRPYLASDTDADALLQLALRGALSLPTATIEFAASARVGNDRSLRARELREAGGDVPAFDLAKASPEVRALLAANGDRIALPDAAPLERPPRLAVKDRQPSTDGIWRVPHDVASEIELHPEPWYAAVERVEWIAEVPAFPRCNLVAADDDATGFAQGAPPRPRWREVKLAPTGPIISTDQLSEFFDSASGCGALRMKARAVVDGRVRETAAIEIRRVRGAGFHAALTEQFGLPYLFGSGSLRSSNETGPETGWGADCANFVVYALRRQGLRIPWSNPKQLRAFLTPRDEAKLTAAEVERGVVIHFGNHVAALLEDHAPVGVLDPGDLVVHQLEGMPETLTLGALRAQRAGARFDLYSVPPRLAEADLIIGGDVMLARSVGDAITAGADPFAGIRPLLSGVQNVLVNLECALGGTAARAANKRYIFRGPAPAAATIAAAGINVVNLANNHAGDFGPEGLAETRALLAQNNITAADSPEPQILTTKDGRRIAILAFSDLTAEARPSAESIAAARATSDLLVCFVHWGEENRAEVTERQRELARWLIENGVDLIAGSHPHTVQPLDYYRGCPIIYSLGNLVFDGAPTVRGWNRGVLARITLTGRRGAALQLVPVELDRRGFPQPAAIHPPAPNSLATAGAARSRKRVIGLSKNR